MEEESRNHRNNNNNNKRSSITIQNAHFFRNIVLLTDSVFHLEWYEQKIGRVRLQELEHFVKQCNDNFVAIHSSFHVRSFEFTSSSGNKATGKDTCYLVAAQDHPEFNDIFQIEPYVLQNALKILRSTDLAKIKKFFDIRLKHTESDDRQQNEQFRDYCKRMNPIGLKHDKLYHILQFNRLLAANGGVFINDEVQFDRTEDYSEDEMRQFAKSMDSEGVGVLKIFESAVKSIRQLQNDYKGSSKRPMVGTFVKYDLLREMSITDTFLKFKRYCNGCYKFVVKKPGQHCVDVHFTSIVPLNQCSSDESYPLSIDPNDMKATNPLPIYEHYCTKACNDQALNVTVEDKELEHRSCVNLDMWDSLGDYAYMLKDLHPLYKKASRFPFGIVDDTDDSSANSNGINEHMLWITPLAVSSIIICTLVSYSS